MALSATIFKCRLQVSDLDRGYYATHELTIARHPSENDARMMVRVLAFALHADERLAFTRGLSSAEEPDLWARDLDDSIALWIELGQVEEKRVRRACGRAREVVVYGYQARAAEVWWRQAEAELARFDRLEVRQLDDEVVADLAAMSARNMDLQVTIQDREAWVSAGERQTVVRWRTLKSAGESA